MGRECCVTPAQSHSPPPFPRHTHSLAPPPLLNGSWGLSIPRMGRHWVPPLQSQGILPLPKDRHVPPLGHHHGELNTVSRRLRGAPFRTRATNRKEAQKQIKRSFQQATSGRHRSKGLDKGLRAEQGLTGEWNSGPGTSKSKHPKVGNQLGAPRRAERPEGRAGGAEGDQGDARAGGRRSPQAGLGEEEGTGSTPYSAEASPGQPTASFPDAK